MKYSLEALFLLAAKQTKLIKSNAKFWKEYSNHDVVKVNLEKNDEIRKAMDNLKSELELDSSIDGFVCPFDDQFPIINNNVKKNREKPYLLFYKGNIDLLSDLNNNVAIIGCTDPKEEVVRREQRVLSKLLANNLVVISGLAKGCDSISHKVCVDNSKPTIAVLPSTIAKIYPAENRELSKGIVNTGGLLVSEYYFEADTKYEAVGRFIDRDRLQAMFAKSIILIASYRKGEGDSGSRHAMGYAKSYNINSYALYSNKDIANIQFGLNKDLIESQDYDVKTLTTKSIDEITNSKIDYIQISRDEQLSLLNCNDSSK